MVHVETENQLAGMLTKGVIQVKFKFIRRKLMG